MQTYLAQSEHRDTEWAPPITYAGCGDSSALWNCWKRDHVWTAPPPHHISTLPSPTATHPSVTCKEIEDDDVIAAEHRRNDPIHWLSFCDREGRAVLDTGPSVQVTTIWAAKWTKCVCSCITTHHWNVWVDGRVKYRSENFKKSSEGSYLARHLCA